jgi:hypothetical protein
MNVKQSIQFLEKKGFKVYVRGNSFSVWFPTQKNNKISFRYSARELVKLAKAYHNSPGPSNGRKETGKFVVGRVWGCTIGPMNYVKTKTHRRERRREKQNLKNLDNLE